MPEGQKKIFRYKDDKGVDHFTTDLDSVPKKFKEKVTEFVPKARKKAIEKAEDLKETAKSEGVEKAKALGEKALKHTQKLKKQLSEHVPHVEKVHTPSAMLGFGLCLGLVVIYGVAKSGTKLLFKIAVIALVIALLSGGYLGLGEMGG